MHFRPRDAILRGLTAELRARPDCDAVAIFQYDSDFEREFSEGDDLTIMAVLSNVVLPDERRLSWEQVREFKSDAASMAQYRQFIRWLSPQLAGRSVAQISEILADRYDQYCWALNSTLSH